MTYRYYNIRRDICNDSSENELKRLRTFKEMKKLHKPFHWIIIVLILISLVLLVFISFLCENKLWCTIPLIIIIICTKIWEMYADKLYNRQERKNELENLNESYVKHLKKLCNIFIKNGIDTKEKCEYLRLECETIFNEREKRYEILNNRIFELLVGAPVGALITTIISNNNDIIPAIVVVILLLGVSIYAVIAIVKNISFYTQNYRNDQKVINAINEIYYCFNTDGSIDSDSN